LNGLIVLEPHATKIINGEKEFEFRYRNPPKQYQQTIIYLLTGGYILGRIKIIGFGWDEYQGAYYWRIKVITKYKTRKKYNHPNGAQVWVKNIGTTQTKL